MVVDFRTAEPGRGAIVFVTVVFDLPGLTMLRGLETERVSVILTARLGGCLTGATGETVLDFLETTVPVAADGLLTIGRVIRVVLGETRVLFEIGVGNLGAIAVRVDFVVIVVVERRVGETVVVLLERTVGCVVVVDRLLTITGWVMRVVCDGLMVRFEGAAGDLYVVEV